MRKDMFKVIVERPRAGSRSAPRIKNRHDPAPERSKVGLKRAAKERTGDWMGIKENLAPLKRYLAKQKGRPWSKVHAEISKRLSSKRTGKGPLSDHLDDFIVTRVSIGKKGEWLRNASEYPGGVELEDGWPDLYVDPYDGIIKETAKLRKKLGIKVRVYRGKDSLHCPAGQIDIGFQTSHLKINGVWYFISFEKPVEEAGPAEGNMIQVWVPGPWSGARENDEGKMLWARVVEKRQLKKADLKKAGLKND